MEISIKRVSYLSSFGFLIVFALACASSGCVGSPDEIADDVAQPDEPIDHDFPEAVAVEPSAQDVPDAGSPSPDAETPSVPDTEPTVPDAPPCCAPEHPPVISLASLPTIYLAGGANAVFRMTVTASDEDVYLKKLTLSGCSTSPSGEINAPALREVGMGSNLPGVADVALDASGCGTGNSLYRIRIVLDVPYAIAAYESRTLDLRVTILAFQTGESLTTGIRQDLSGPACGALTGTCADLGIAGAEQNIIWSNDLDAWHNGDAIGWNPAGAQTLTRP